PGGRHLQRKDLGTAEGLDDLRTGPAGVAALENPAGRQLPDVIGPGVPPLRAFAAHLIELEHAVRLSPAGIVGDAPAGDERPGPFVHDAPGLVLVHPEEDEVPGEVARLGDAANDRPADLAGEWILGAEIIRSRVSEERLDVAERRGASAEHVRIFDGVNQLVQVRRVESVPQAELDRQHRDWRWR